METKKIKNSWKKNNKNNYGPHENSRRRVFRSLMNHNVKEIWEDEDVVKFIKTQRLRWFGHIMRRINVLESNRMAIENQFRGRWREQVMYDLRIGARELDEVTRRQKILVRNDQ